MASPCFLEEAPTGGKSGVGKLGNLAVSKPPLYNTYIGLRHQLFHVKKKLQGVAVLVSREAWEEAACLTHLGRSTFP